jgi:hypothetical protein
MWREEAGHNQAHRTQENAVFLILVRLCSLGFCVPSSELISNFVQWLIRLDNEGAYALLPRAQGLGLSKIVCKPFRNFSFTQSI